MKTHWISSRFATFIHSVHILPCICRVSRCVLDHVPTIRQLQHTCCCWNISVARARAYEFCPIGHTHGKLSTTRLLHSISRCSASAQAHREYTTEWNDRIFVVECRSRWLRRLRQFTQGKHSSCCGVPESGVESHQDRAGLAST